MKLCEITMNLYVKFLQRDHLSPPSLLFVSVRWTFLEQINFRSKMITQDSIFNFYYQAEIAWCLYYYHVKNNFISFADQTNYNSVWQQPKHIQGVPFSTS